MQFQATLFDGKKELLEGTDKQDALTKAKLVGDNKWMLFSCEPLIKITRNLNDVVMESLGLKKGAS